MQGTTVLPFYHSNPLSSYIKSVPLSESGELKILQETQYKMIVRAVPDAVIDPEPSLRLINSVLQETADFSYWLLQMVETRLLYYPWQGRSCQNCY